MCTGTGCRQEVSRGARVRFGARAPERARRRWRQVDDRTYEETEQTVNAMGRARAGWAYAGTVWDYATIHAVRAGAWPGRRARACVTRGWAIWVAGRRRKTNVGRRGGGRPWQAGSVAERTFTGSLTKHAGASLPSAWACSAWPVRANAVRLRVRRREPREAGQVRAGHKARGRAQQVCAAGAQQARAVPWAGRGSTPLRAAPALGDLRESADV